MLAQRLRRCTNINEALVQITAVFVACPVVNCCLLYSARALVKKTQEPGIKIYRKLIFSGMIPGHLPRRIPKMPQKSPLCIFFNSRWPPPCNAIFEKQGYTLILHFCS